MSHGLEVYNANGHPIFSSDYPSLRIVEEGVVTSKSYYGADLGGVITLPTDGLLFVNASQAIAKMAITRSPYWGVGSGQVGIVAYTHSVLGGESPRTLSIPYIIAKTYEGMTPAASGYGLEVIGSGGYLNFSTDYDHLPVLASIRLGATTLHPNHNYGAYKIGEYVLPYIRPLTDVWVCLNETLPICTYVHQDSYDPYGFYHLHRAPFLQISHATGVRVLTIYDNMVVKKYASTSDGQAHDVYPTNRNFLVALR